jgi:branched-chain amino acid transport system substrate-binding protein
MSVTPAATPPSRSRGRRSVAVATVAATALLLSACSGDAEEPADDSSAAASPTREEETPTDALSIGAVLPFTAYDGAGQPPLAGYELAIEDINAAGGVFGQEVVSLPKDSTDNNDTANQAVDSLVTEGANFVIGAYGSGMSGSMITKVTEAGMVQISGSNTSSGLTGISPNYRRTAPTDVLESAYLANLMVDEGRATAAIVVQNDDWGTAFEEAMVTNLEAAGIEVVANESFNTTDTDYSAQIAAVTAADPEAVIFLSYAAYTGAMLDQLVGVDGFATDAIYFSNSTLGNEYTIDPSLLTGIRGYLAGPPPEIEATFEERLLEHSPDLANFAYAAATYDATILAALAAAQSNSTDAETLAQAVIDVSGGIEGAEKCTEIADCLALVDAGTPVDYDGLSGELELDENGDTTATNYNLYQYGAEGTYELAEQ